MKQILEKPEGLILTVSAGMIGENGYSHWLRNFLYAMRQENWTYSFRQGNKPRQEPLYVYLCIGGKIRYRTLFVRSLGPCMKRFSDNREMFGKAWIEVCGPVTKPKKPILRKGFQGIRYTEMLF